jgi:methionyl-tRNA synthetase
MDAVEVTAALEEIWQRVRELNRYVQDEAPWKLAKEEGAGERLDEILYGLAEGLRVVSLLLHPFIPDSTGKLLAALGQDDRSLAAARLGDVDGGARVGELPPLFPRIESRE